MAHDLDRITKRLLAGNKSIHYSRLKAHKLGISIQAEIQDQEKRGQNQKRLS